MRRLGRERNGGFRAWRGWRQTFVSQSGRVDHLFAPDGVTGGDDAPTFTSTDKARLRRPYRDHRGHDGVAIVHGARRRLGPGARSRGVRGRSPAGECDTRPKAATPVASRGSQVSRMPTDGQAGEAHHVTATGRLPVARDCLCRPVLGRPGHLRRPRCSQSLMVHMQWIMPRPASAALRAGCASSCPRSPTMPGPASPLILPVPGPPAGPWPG